jgi:cytochrome c5
LGGRGRRISEFEASLVYRVSSRTARATQRNPVSKQQTNKQQQQQQQKKERKGKKRKEKEIQMCSGSPGREQLEDLGEQSDWDSLWFLGF